MKDWIGNSRSYASILGARNFAKEEREINDYYATDPESLRVFLKKLEEDGIVLNKNILECACGQGHLSEVLLENGYYVTNIDIVNRGYNKNFIETDYLKFDKKFYGDVLTNPPYKYAKEFVEKTMDIIEIGSKCVMFLKLQFLEGKNRKIMFQKFPPKYVYVFSYRQRCAMNGNFDKYSNVGNTRSAFAYAWFVWEKGFKGEPVIRWI